LPLREAAAWCASWPAPWTMPTGTGSSTGTSKPGNVLIEPDGEPVLVDFVWRAGRGGRRASRAGRRRTWPRGSGVGRRWRRAISTVWAGLLFELLTGQWPFQAGQPGHFRFLHESRRFPERGRRTGRCPRDLEAICARCLAKETAERYASCAALADDLAHWEAGEPVAARPPGPLERVAKWVKRNPVVAGLSVRWLLCWWQAWWPPAADRLAVAETAEAKKQTGIALGKEADAKHQTDRAEEQLARAEVADLQR